MRRKNHIRGPIEKQINSDKPLDKVQLELINADIAAAKGSISKADWDKWHASQDIWGEDKYKSNRQKDRDSIKATKKEYIKIIEKQMDYVYGPNPVILSKPKRVRKPLNKMKP